MQDTSSQYTSSSEGRTGFAVNNLSGSSSKKATNIDELIDKVEKLEKIVASLTYEATVNLQHLADGQNTDFKSLQETRFGEAGIFTGQNFAGAERAIMSAGSDSNGTRGSNNSIMILENQGATNGTLNWSFFYGYRYPNYGGVLGDVSSGTTLTQKDVSIEEDKLVGAYLLLGPDSSGYTESHVITSNTKDTITFATASSIDSEKAVWFVSVPIYLGSANFPWRRTYVTSETSGGVRFGEGATNGGKNGLLYTNSAGDLYYRNYGGSSTKLN